MMGLFGVLANIVEVTSPDGEHVVDLFEPMMISALYLFLLLLPILLILLLFYYKKKCQHQQIMAAIDKGIPVTDLIARPTPRDREINWVRSLSAGIGFVFIGAVLAVYWFWRQFATGIETMDPAFLIIPVVVGGMGLIYLFRGLFQKSCEKRKIQTPEQ